jgi:cobalt-zinc-cadmium efflux system membrane fusion protein
MDQLANTLSGTAAAAVAWPRRRQISVLGVAVGLLVLAMVVVWLVQRSFGHEASADVAPTSPPGTFQPTSQQLKTLTVEPVALRSFVSEERTEGKIAVNGDRTTPVFSPYSGRITRVLVSLGEVVSQSQPLATIEATEFAQAENDLRTALAQVTLTRKSEARKHALYDIKGGSLADWQQSQADLATAETTLASVRSRLRILGYSDAQVAELEHSDHFDPTTNILAPIHGVIVDRQVGPGQYAQAGASTPAFTIADLSSVWLIANVREADAGHVQRGQTAEVHVLAYPDRIFTAHVIYVAPTIDPNTHRLTVRAVIDNADGALKPEMFANFRIVTSEGTQSPAVPESAVIYEGASAHVWVVQSGNSIAIRPIRIGRSNDGYVEVIDGLEAGDRVVTRGSLFIDRAAAG